ncbi:MAG: hypothetical protein A2Z14_02355 [Chloroflexi bacterium RBG_16_48_8]|nr:MAG: hypothetical protein A2Z14_02355 [Chloroflexi bacterium RBG_16_48_8]
MSQQSANRMEVGYVSCGLAFSGHQAVRFGARETAQLVESRPGFLRHVGMGRERELRCHSIAIFVKLVKHLSIHLRRSKKKKRAGSLNVQTAVAMRLVRLITLRHGSENPKLRLGGGVAAARVEALPFDWNNRTSKGALASPPVEI